MIWRLLRTRPAPASVISLLALFIALGSTSYAAVVLTGKNIKNGTITSKDIKSSTLTGRQIKNGSLTGSDLKTGSVTGKQVAESKLGKVPSAASADTATNAKTAGSVGGRTAASLQVKCPTGTAAAGGVCIELAQRAAKDWNQASIDCGARGLPNLSQLLSFISSHSGLSGSEWSSEIFGATPTTTLGVIDMATGIVSGAPNTPHPYRCMTTPAN